MSFPRALCLFVLLLLAGVARADNVSTLLDQLKDGSERERLAAVAALIKLGDQKAILPLAKVVLEKNESSSDVRRVAAQGLGSLVTSSTSKTVKGLVIKNLQDTEANDSDSQVKSAASASLTALGSGASSNPNANAGTTVNATSVYVNVGPMSSKTTSKNNPQIMKMMNSTATASLAKTAYAVTWAGGTPTASQLQAKSVAGFYVDGTMTDLIVKTSGASATVTCKVSMLLAAFPSKSMFGFPNGGASVQTGSSQKDIDSAAEDCVQAVVENLITKQILPTIKSKTGISP